MKIPSYILSTFQEKIEGNKERWLKWSLLWEKYSGTGTWASVHCK